MVYKKSQYNIHNGTGYDVYHHETSSDSVKVMSGQNVLSDLQELLLTGKLETGKAITSIKMSGTYVIRNMTGLPASVSNINDLILLVSAVGPLGSPTMTHYQIVGRDGSIHNKTVIGGADNGWTIGGTSLQQMVNKVTNDLGNINSLTTTAKGNIVSAVNEVSNAIKAMNIQLGNTTEELGDHNHDERYVKVSGNASTLATDLYVSQGKGLSLKRPNDSLANLISTNASGGVEVGNVGSTLNLYGSQSLLHNGKKVWSEVNHGAGSGLDADKLDGHESTAFARKTAPNTFSELQTYQLGIDLSNSNIRWGTGRINFTPTSMTVTHGGKNLLNISTNGHNTLPTMDLIANYSGGPEARLLFKLASGDGGIGFVRAANGELRMRNYTQGQDVFKVANGDNVLQLTREVQIQGRKLFLQGSTPTGNIPVGSIWIY